MNSININQTIEQHQPVKIATVKVGHILDLSFSLLFKQMHWLILFGIFTALPLIVPTIYEFITKSDNVLSEVYYDLFSIVDSVIGFLLTGTMILACRNWHNDSNMSWSTAFLDACRQSHRILGANILVGLAIIAGLICLIIPGIVLLLNFACILQVLLIERAGILDSFQRSTQMTKGSRWRILGLLISCYMIVFIIEIAGGFLMHVVATEGTSDRAAHIFQSFISPSIYALIGFATTYLYYDLREKKEGLDLIILAKQIDVAAAGTPT